MTNVKVELYLLYLHTAIDYRCRKLTSWPGDANADTLTWSLWYLRLSLPLSLTIGDPYFEKCNVTV